MRIWVIKASEPTLHDVRVRGIRPFRYGLLTTAALERGDEVVWWTDDFDHFRKVHRFGKDTCIPVSRHCKVYYVHTPGYRQNVSLARFMDHRVLADRIFALARSLEPPDVIVAGMPADVLCDVAIRLGRQMGAKVVLDVRDLWPDVFIERAPSGMKPLAWMLTRPMARKVRRVFASADAIVGNTERFVQWGLRQAGRMSTPLDGVFPLAYRPPDLTPQEREDALQSLARRGILIDGTFTVCFLGSIGPLYDFGPVCRAAELLEQRGANVRFVLCGDGASLTALRSNARNLASVKTPGWLSHAEAWVLMESSHLGLAPYRDLVNFRDNLPNKPAEYLAASLPVLVGIDGVISELVHAWSCGSRYTTGDHLAQLVLQYSSSPSMYLKERANAKALFDAELDASAVYARFVDHLHTVASGRVSVSSA